jgi:hypothetical protein
MHVGRRPAEPPQPSDDSLRTFYGRLLEVLKRPEVHEGQWRLATCRPAWDGNPTHAQFIVSSWQAGERRLISVVNYGPSQGQCYAQLGLPDLAGRTFDLVDLLDGPSYRRNGDDLAGGGLYLDMPPWGYQVFAMQPT